MMELAQCGVERLHIMPLFCQPSAVKMKKTTKGRRGGKKAGLSETDCSLQRATIKLSKYHYQVFNKVAAVRY